MGLLQGMVTDEQLWCAGFCIPISAALRWTRCWASDAAVDDFDQDTNSATPLLTLKYKNKNKSLMGNRLRVWPGPHTPSHSLSEPKWNCQVILAGGGSGWKVFQPKSTWSDIQRSMVQSLPRSQEKPEFVSKRCADSLSKCPAHVCICTHWKNHVKGPAVPVPSLTDCEKKTVTAQESLRGPKVPMAPKAVCRLSSLMTGVYYTI